MHRRETKSRVVSAVRGRERERRATCGWSKMLTSGKQGKGSETEDWGEDGIAGMGRRTREVNCFVQIDEKDGERFRL